MIKNKVLKICCIIGILASVGSCQQNNGLKSGGSDDDPNLTEEEIIPYYPAKPAQYGGEPPKFLTPEDRIEYGVIEETDYTKIIAYTEFEEYDSDIEEIKFFVKDTNKNRAFYLDGNINQFECLINGEWVQQPFAGTEIMVYDLISTEAHIGPIVDGCVIAQKKFNVSKLYNKLETGEYRIIAFVGDETVYAPFTIK
jgi:hypothetical protein